MLHTAPSFSIYNDDDGFEVARSEVTAKHEYAKMGTNDFTFGEKGMTLIEEIDEGEEKEENGVVAQPNSPKMYLATGLGMMNDDDESRNNNGVDSEEYCKRMVDEYPSNALHLKNYAHVLLAKGDLHGAEDYYYRATVADPRDGEAMSQYAKLVWELNHDQDRALNYFGLALQVAPNDSHILEAYTCFLWELEDNVTKDTTDTEENYIKTALLDFVQSFYYDPYELGPSHNTKKKHVFAPKEVTDGGKTEEQESSKKVPATGSEIRFAGFSGGTSGVDEVYYKQMVDENPNNSLVLGNYAQFLYQVKGDLEVAEEYYSRAIVADPKDGKMMSQYAKLVWELHHDREKVSSYFQRAVQASSGDCDVLAAYASFLWDVHEDDEESVTEEEGVQKQPTTEEEYYSRAVLAEPGDGEMLSQYATYLWEELRDQDKASFYFDQSVKATPSDCNVLAAHASFLWETEAN